MSLFTRWIVIAAVIYQLPLPQADAATDPSAVIDASNKRIEAIGKAISESIAEMQTAGEKLQSKDVQAKLKNMIQRCAPDKLKGIAKEAKKNEKLKGEFTIALMDMMSNAVQITRADLAICQADGENASEKTSGKIADVKDKLKKMKEGRQKLLRTGLGRYLHAKTSEINSGYAKAQQGEQFFRSMPFLASMFNPCKGSYDRRTGQYVPYTNMARDMRPTHQALNRLTRAYDKFMKNLALVEKESGVMVAAYEKAAPKIASNAPVCEPPKVAVQDPPAEGAK